MNALKPRLRGVFHQWAFFAAVAAGITLLALADGARSRAGVAVYAASLAAMFGASAIYHRVPWRSAAARVWARRVDHSMIYVFIAGSYTPFALLVLHGALPTVVLAVVWAGAALGLFFNLVWIHAPRWLAAILYLGLGWVGVVTFPQLIEHGGVAPMVLVVVGGGLYTAGALIYTLGRPNPFPATLGFHEIFHLLVIAAAATQFVSITLVVL
ncbi:MAG: hemolysin III family protein [Actinobacteria bacterium]|nr:hemolysin III family protein [Actinomycetota bacterium]